MFRYSCVVSVLQCVAVCSGVLQCVAVCCSVLQCVGCRWRYQYQRIDVVVLQCVAVCCSVLHDCNTLQHTATHCNTLQHTATCCNALQRTATHCNTLRHSGFVASTTTGCCIYHQCPTPSFDSNSPSKEIRFRLFSASRLMIAASSAGVAVCCSVLQRVAACCSVLWCVLD